MTKSKIIQYIHRPNLTELGIGNTHDRYMVVDAEKDLTDIFPLNEGVDLLDISNDKIYNIYSKVENSEFRVKKLGDIVDDYHMEPGDEIVITHYESPNYVLNTLNVNECGRVFLNPGKRENGAIVDFEIFNIERLPDFKKKQYQSYDCEYNGNKAELSIKFSESRKKRTDSPKKTDFYSIEFDDDFLKYEPGENYYLTIKKDFLVLKKLPKSEYHNLLEKKISYPNENINILNKDFALQQIFYGAPGTGKSNTIKKLVDNNGKIHFRTTFHPDSDYSTFVGAYKPRMENGKIIYSFEPQAFTKAYVEAWKTNDDVYLIIEEINRGNCAQIFGDIFQLLDRKNGESEYSIKADSALAVFLKAELIESKREIPEKIKNGEELKLPSNFYIWATMNTSDQSLFPIDSAFKRRWNWKYIKIAKGKDKETKKDLEWIVDFNFEDGEKKYKCSFDWWEFILRINDIIASAISSDDKKLGYFFCKPRKEDGTSIDAETFVGKVVFYLWNDVLKEEKPELFKVHSTKGEPSFDAFYIEDEEGETVVDTLALKDFISNVFGDDFKEKVLIEEIKESEDLVLTSE